MNEQIEEEISKNKYVDTIEFLEKTMPNDANFGAAARAFINKRRKLIEKYQNDRNTK